MRHNPGYGIMAFLVREGGIIAVGRQEGADRRHVDAIGRGVVVGARVVGGVDRHPGCREKRLELGVRLGPEVAGRLRAAIVALRQAVDLIGVENGVKLGEHPLAAVAILVRRRLGLVEGAELDNRARPLALPHLRAELLRLPIGEPMRRGVAFGVGLEPKEDDVDPAVGLTTGAERKGCAAPVAGPRLPPRRGARLDGRDDAIRHRLLRVKLAGHGPSPSRWRGAGVFALGPLLGGAVPVCRPEMHPHFLGRQSGAGDCPTRGRAGVGQPGGGAPGAARSRRRGHGGRWSRRRQSPLAG